MIKITNISKTYESKKGMNCIAVNNVSIELKGNGMVFIIGKSGSGKSTLLNLLAGLDTADKGEMIIDGKSINSFSQKDFDSYRNGYVGFVFQDFSIIDDLNIKENIALAVQLQNKAVTDEEVSKALAMVNLAGYENRQANELSGGQKQRIAIARALIKEPKIIFADEPTGSLDSNSGEHIWSLFKELSKTRLVVVVSHDLDSALMYGDRIIELADGKVVADRTKKNEVSLSEIKKEYQAKIDESFVNTVIVEDSSQEKNKFKYIQTALPVKFSAKIAFSNFAKKKLKFIFTLFLMIIALTVMGLSNTLKDYNYINASLSTFKKLDINTLNVSSYKLVDGEIEPTKEIIEFDKEKLAALQKETNASIFTTYQINAEFRPYNILEIKEYKFENRLSAIAEFDVENVDEQKLKQFYNAKLISGNYPKPNENFMEIIISDYVADSIMYYGAKFDNKVVIPNTGYESIYDGYICYYNFKIKIVGVYETDYKSVDFKAKKNFQATFNLKSVYEVALTTKNAGINIATKTPYYKAQMALREGDKNAVSSNSVIIGTNSVTLLKLALPNIEAPNVKYIEGKSSLSLLKDNEVIVTMSYIRNLLQLQEMDISGNYLINFDNLDVETFKNKEFKLNLHEESRKEISQNIKIIGVIDDEMQNAFPDFMEDVFITSPNLKNACIEDSLFVYNVYLSIGADKAENQKILNYMENNNLEFLTFATKELVAFDKLFKLIYGVLDYTTIVLSLFSLLLISNFISNSILSRKKEIGILRAMGARGKDIAKIFAIESIGIIIINLIFASIFMLVGIFTLNMTLTSIFPTNLTIIVFSFLSWAIMVISCIIIVAIASILPLWQISRKRPIDVIRDK